jgi:cobyrinic acid a,c-diamide synthase
MAAPAIIIAAPASGAGKTSVTLGIVGALRRRGLAVGSFKAGPDFIDPRFLEAASGRPCPNLDSWAMRFETLVGQLQDAAKGADILIGEGVMGLFDGAPGGSGSTGDLAALCGIPVVLVVDAAGMGASAAALVEGFLRFREDVDVAGVIFNRIGGESHLRLLREACDERFATPILGGLPKEPAVALPSRHLGLVQAIEQGELPQIVQRLAGLAETRLDLGRLMRLARHPSVTAFGRPTAPLPPLGQRIAVARDAAFAFTYGSMLEGWQRQGAELGFFSPLADEPPAGDADAVFLPGGYPELHAARLAAGSRWLEGLRARAAAGAAIYGECGGYMALGRDLVDSDGQHHAMAGLLPVATSFATPRLQLGYREVRTVATGHLGVRGAAYRGHEFHYAVETERGGTPLFTAMDARGRPLGETGSCVGRVAGSFIHLIDRSPQPRG